MRQWVVVVVGVALWLGSAPAGADVLYQLRVRTADGLVRGTVEFEEEITVSVKGDRRRLEESGTRTVVTRRGLRYQRPGHHVTLDQLDRGLRYEVNVDAGTYVEEPFASLRRRRQESVASAEKALGVDAGEATPALPVSVQRTGERQEVHGRECERVVLKAVTDVLLAATRGSPGGGLPSRISATYELCVARESAALRELRAVEDRVEELADMRSALADRELRIFARRRDVYAVFELMQRLMDREERRLGGAPIRWERVFVGPRRDQPQATLYRQTGEVVRIEDTPLDPGRFELPAGLALDPRGAAR